MNSLENIFTNPINNMNFGTSLYVSTRVDIIEKKNQETITKQ
jgi:hypothetical protein